MKVSRSHKDSCISRREELAPSLSHKRAHSANFDVSDTAVAGVEAGLPASMRGPAPQVLTSQSGPADHCIVDALLGERIQLWWDGNNKWFIGRIHKYSQKSKRFLVAYDDGMRKWHDLSEDWWQIISAAPGPSLVSAGLRTRSLARTDRAPSGWALLRLQCAISGARLVRPSRLTSCCHAAACNLEQLRSCEPRVALRRNKSCRLEAGSLPLYQYALTAGQERSSMQIARRAPAVQIHL
eukprot:1999377-Pleurochrysis_carterae.AAC.3